MSLKQFDLVWGELKNHKRSQMLLEKPNQDSEGTTNQKGTSQSRLLRNNKLYMQCTSVYKTLDF